MEKFYNGIEIGYSNAMRVTKSHGSVSKDSATCNFISSKIGFSLNIKKNTLNNNFGEAEKS